MNICVLKKRIISDWVFDPWTILHNQCYDRQITVHWEPGADLKKNSGSVKGLKPNLPMYRIYHRNPLLKIDFMKSWVLTSRTIWPYLI